jgi:hypothetical protein
MTDQREIASKALKELRRVQPNASLSFVGNEMPFEANAERDHYLEAFRRAGLEQKRRSILPAAARDQLARSLQFMAANL